MVQGWCSQRASQRSEGGGRTRSAWGWREESGLDAQGTSAGAEGSQTSRVCIRRRAGTSHAGAASSSISSDITRQRAQGAQHGSKCRLTASLIAQRTAAAESPAYDAAGSCASAVLSKRSGVRHGPGQTKMPGCRQATPRRVAAFGATHHR